MLFVVFDTETTGLPKHPDAKMSVQPKIIEFGAALVDENCEVHDTLQLLINPYEELEEVITKITGLTDEDLVDEPPFLEVYPQIKSMFERAQGVVAHNLPFDFTLVNMELQRHELTADFTWPRHKICTVQENVPTWGRRPKLTALYKHLLDKPLAQTHRALDDVMALLEVVKEQEILHAYVSATARTL